MLYRDTDISRQLAQDRQAELARDWHRANSARIDVVESRRRQLRLRFGRLRAHVLFRPAGHTS